VTQTASATQSLQQETEALAQGVAGFKFAAAAAPARVVVLKHPAPARGSNALRKAEAEEWAEF
jgi:hypothetical protein